MPSLEQFVHEHSPRWRAFEEELDRRSGGDPDRIATLFVELTDDLSYARTFFPEAESTRYLNGLAARAHQSIYRRKKESASRFRSFFSEEVPLELFRARREITTALFLFIILGLIGLVSTMNDDDFARSFFGDGYVNMTLENIENEDPMGVYGQESQFDMVMMITTNNLRVGLIAFVLGALFSIGTFYILIVNGVMVGTFLAMLAREGVLFESIQAIFIHGTIELSAIVVAAGAGFVMGNALLFPGTYSRTVAFRRGAIRGLKIYVGLVPFIVAAGILESFVTRYYLVSPVLNFAIIGLSLLLIVWYFILFPARVARRMEQQAIALDPELAERPWATARLVDDPVALPAS